MAILILGQGKQSIFGSFADRTPSIAKYYIWRRLVLEVSAKGPRLSCILGRLKAWADPLDLAGSHHAGDHLVDEVPGNIGDAVHTIACCEHSPF
jgi:hypothetical protein